MCGHYRRGFTLVELVVVIAITASISTLALAGLRQGERSRLLRGASTELAGLVRRTEVRAVASEVIPGTNTVPAGYGLTVTAARTVIVFADINGNGCRDDGESDIDTWTPPDGITLSPVVTPLRCSPEQIAFRTATGAALINGACLGTDALARFELRQTSSNFVKSVVFQCFTNRVVIE